MKLNTLQSQVLPSLVEGTSRRPLPTEPDRALEMLSLMGQALRFDRPPGPSSFVVEEEIHDDRKILADRLRRPLVRLLTAKHATEHPARAMARTFERLRLRPHPFDLPLIDAFVRAHAERLGATALHWVDRQRPEAAPRGYFDPELLDEINWVHATPSRRVAYLTQRRQDNADAARALVESTWAQEDADARFRLLQVFQIGLSSADQPFLASLEKDRAPRVRTLAASLLSGLGVAKNPALAACMERIKQGKSGLLRKRITLQLELPANVKDEAAPRWILQTFAEVSFGELADACQLGEKELIESAEKDENLLLALALMATNEHRFDVLELVIANLPNPWDRIFESGLDTLGTMTEDDRRRWEEMIMRPYGKDLPAAYPPWDWMHRITDAAATPAIMSTVLRSDLLAKVREPEPSSGPWADVFAAMCPSSQRQELRDQLTNFEPSQAATALALLDILDGMENDRIHV